MLEKLKESNYTKVLLSFVSSQMLTNLLRLISGFVVVKALSPEDYGQFTGMSVYIGYIALIQVGIIQGLSRDLPFEMGRNNKLLASNLVSSTYAFTLLISIIGGIFYFILGIILAFKGENVLAFISLAYIIIGGFDFLNRFFFPTLYKTSKEFKWLGRHNVVLASLNLLSVLFVFWFGLMGLILRALLVVIFDFGLKYYHSPMTISVRISLVDLKRLLKTGFPMFISSQSVQLWITITNNILFVVGGPVLFGLFGLSSILQNSIGVIPRSLSQVVFPNMAIEVSRGASVKQVLTDNLKNLIGIFFVILLLVVSVHISIPFIVYEFLPNYVDGIDAAQWIILIPLIQSFSALGNIFAVIKNMRPVILANVTGSVASLIFILISMQFYSFKLEIFAKGIVLGYLIQQSLILLSVYQLMRKNIFEINSK